MCAVRCTPSVQKQKAPLTALNSFTAFVVARAARSLVRMAYSYALCPAHGLWLCTFTCAAIFSSALYAIGIERTCLSAGHTQRIGTYVLRISVRMIRHSAILVRYTSERSGTAQHTLMRVYSCACIRQRSMHVRLMSATPASPHLRVPRMRWHTLRTCEHKLCASLRG